MKVNKRMNYKVQCLMQLGAQHLFNSVTIKHATTRKTS